MRCKEYMLCTVRLESHSLQKALLCCRLSSPIYSSTNVWLYVPQIFYKCHFVICGGDRTGQSNARAPTCTRSLNLSIVCYHTYFERFWQPGRSWLSVERKRGIPRDSRQGTPGWGTSKLLALSTQVPAKRSEVPGSGRPSSLR